MFKKGFAVSSVLTIPVTSQKVREHAVAHKSAPVSHSRSHLPMVIEKLRIPATRGGDIEQIFRGEHVVGGVFPS